MPHLDEGTIHAWLDGALPDEERANVERHVAGCESCAAGVAEARGFVAGATRILSALDDVPSAALPGKGGAGGGARSLTSRRSLWRTLQFTPARAAAAAVLIVAAGTFMTLREAQKSGDVARPKLEAPVLANDSSPGANVASAPPAGIVSPSPSLQPPPSREAPLPRDAESKKDARHAQAAQVATATPSTTRLSEVVRDAPPRPTLMREEVPINKAAVAAPVVESASIKLRGVAADAAGRAASVVGCYAVATTNFDKDASTLPSLISLDSAPAPAEAVRSDAETFAQQRERRAFAPPPPVPAAARAPASAGARAPAPTPAPAAAAAADAATGRMDSMARGERPRALSILARPGDAAMSYSESAVRGYWTSAVDGSVFVRLPSVTGAPPRSFVLRAEPSGLSGMLQESGRSVPISLRRVSCR
jgi:Putative zinc-finger